MIGYGSSINYILLLTYQECYQERKGQTSQVRTYERRYYTSERFKAVESILTPLYTLRSVRTTD